MKSKIIKTLTQGSLKKKLTLAFAGVVLFAAVLSAVVFTLFLVENFKKSTRQQLKGTFRVAEAKIEEISRGFEIYTDLIASDMQFGQLLAYDSQVGIQSKVEEFVTMSQAEVVGFVPRPEQYVQIKDQVFINPGYQDLGKDLKQWAKVSNLLSPFPDEGKRGWIQLNNELYLFAAQPVLHFGTNMGFIFIGAKAKQDLAEAIAEATGTDILIGMGEQLFGSSLGEGVDKKSIESTLKQSEMFAEDQRLIEEVRIGDSNFASFVHFIKDVNDKVVGQLAVLISNKELLEARKNTLVRAAIIAAIAALLSAIIGRFIAQAIANPIHEMTEGIEQIGQTEDLSLRIPDKYEDEVGVLANSFNGLMVRLEDANQKLAESERRMKAELTMASTVQEMLFPVRGVQYDSIELASFIEASTETGGDWYGYDKDQDENSVYVMIGDVTGHGMPAALVTAISNGFFRGVLSIENLLTGDRLDEKANIDVTRLTQNIREMGMSMDEVLFNLNQLLIDVTQGKLLMTFFASVLNVKEKRLYYANAGHNRPIIMRKNKKGRVKPTVLKSPPSQRLGENRELEFTEQNVDLETGDLVVWYTDGILECESPDDEQYGRQRLIRQLKKNFEVPCEEIVQKVIKDAYTFYADIPRADDVTLVVGRIS